MSDLISHDKKQILELKAQLAALVGEKHRLKTELAAAERLRQEVFDFEQLNASLSPEMEEGEA